MAFPCAFPKLNGAFDEKLIRFYLASNLLVKRGQQQRYDKFAGQDDGS